MEILNETVYDSGDLEKVMLHAQKKAFERSVAEAIKYNAAQTASSFRQRVPNAPVPLPNQIRFGYYNNPSKDEAKEKVDVCYVSSRGGGYRHNGKAVRIGMTPPTKLPLPEMQIIALAAADKDQRTLPNKVILDLVIVLMRVVFRVYARIDDEQEEKWLLNGCPPVRYGFKADRESAKKSREHALSARLERLHEQIKYAEGRIERLAKEQVEEQEKLEKLRLRLVGVESKKKEVIYVGQ
jgi:hypothetical protein